MKTNRAISIVMNGIANTAYLVKEGSINLEQAFAVIDAQGYSSYLKKEQVEKVLKAL
jgi:hypothetical protein